MLEKCLFFLAKLYTKVIQEGFLCACKVDSRNSIARAQRHFFTLILNIIRLKFVFLIFKCVFTSVIQPCLSSSRRNPKSCIRRFTRGTMPFTLAIYIYLMVINTAWYNRVFAFICSVLIIMIFRRNDYLEEGLFDPKKLIEDEATKNYEYQGVIPDKRKIQIERFVENTQDLQTIFPKFRYNLNQNSNNAHFIRVNWCAFCGKKFFSIFFLS